MSARGRTTASMIYSLDGFTHTDGPQRGECEPCCSSQRSRCLQMGRSLRQFDSHGVAVDIKGRGSIKLHGAHAVTHYKGRRRHRALRGGVVR